jgi:iron complex transport system permease protein
VVLLGGVVALLSDIVSGMPGLDLRLPLNAVTSLLGAPVVATAVLRSERIQGRGGMR